MKNLLILIFALYGLSTLAQDKIYLLDTGVSESQSKYLCESGHMTFDNRQFHPHGTQMVKEMVHDLKSYSNNFCIVSIDIYDDKAKTILLSNMIKALKALKYQKPGIINLSMNGASGSKEESDLLKDLANRGFQINIASGNEQRNLLFACKDFPACYFRTPHKNIHVISNNELKSNKNGPVTHVEQIPHYTNGTSGSTAIHSGRILFEKYRQQEMNKAILGGI
tara:strand:- start:24923 stop:25591 length:669 start_codon:yes stop_codon:yes gene_type:complete